MRGLDSAENQYGLRSRGQERAVEKQSGSTLVNWLQIASLWAAELFQFVRIFESTSTATGLSIFTGLKFVG